jgi:hypothetical protein
MECLMLKCGIDLLIRITVRQHRSLMASSGEAVRFGEKSNRRMISQEYVSIIIIILRL